MRREIVQDGPAGANLYKAISIVDTPAIGVETPIARHEIDGASGVGGQTSTALPDATPRKVGGGVVCHHLLESGCVICQYPAMKRRIISVAGEADIDYTAAKE